MSLAELCVFVENQGLVKDIQEQIMKTYNIHHTFAKNTEFLVSGKACEPESGSWAKITDVGSPGLPILYKFIVFSECGYVFILYLKNVFAK